MNASLKRRFFWNYSKYVYYFCTKLLKMTTTTFKISKTANDTILKFTADRMLTEGSFQFNSMDDAANAPLAQQLFKLPFVKRILFSANFVAIERFAIVEWPEVQDDVKMLMENFLNEGGVLLNSDESKKRIPVEIYTEVTPNPNVLKFVSNKILSPVSVEFKNAEEAKGSPLAIKLFEFPFVTEVFISDNYVSLTKTPALEWSLITPELRTFIKDYIAEGGKIIEDDVKDSSNSSDHVASVNQTSDAVSLKIIQILDEYIRPAVAADGGNIAFESYDPATQSVHVILQGACSGCPSSTITLKNGIEHMLKQLIPGKIGEVIAVNH